jgi:DNA-binding IclR family transcriptional regulator
MSARDRLLSHLRVVCAQGARSLTVAELARVIGTSSRTAQRATRELERAGLIRVLRAVGPNGGGVASGYQLTS